MGYCGCGTKANKGRWGLVCLFLVVAAIFLAINLGLSSQCQVCEDVVTTDGITVRECDDDFGADPDRDWDDIEGCSQGALAATSLIFLIALIASLVPCCCMCCCAHGPQAHATQQYDVAIVGKPADPAAQPYQQSPYGQQQAHGQPGQQHAVV